MARRPRQRIEFCTDGTYRNTKLQIDGKPIYFEGISIAGSKEDDFDITVLLSLSKNSRKTIKDGNTNAVGFEIPDEEAEYDDDE